MPFPQHFIIEGKYLGTSLRKLRHVHEDTIVPYSYAFFCPHCGELWARCPVEGAQEFIVHSISCRKCPANMLYVPGSLFLSWDEEFTQAFPEAVEKWEFEVAMATVKDRV